MAKGARDGKWVRIIGVFKCLKGLLVLLVGSGALKLLHKDVAEEVTRWIERFNIDPQNHLFRVVMEKLDDLDSRKLMLWTVGTLFYAALFLIEGIGLLFLKRWAEYFVIIITGSFLLLEIYELFKKFHAFKIVIIVLNTAILGYLIFRL